MHGAFGLLQGSPCSIIRATQVPRAIRIATTGSQLTSSAKALSALRMWERAGSAIGLAAATIPQKMRALKDQGVDFIYVGSSSFIERNGATFATAALEAGLPVLSPYERLVTEATPCYRCRPAITPWESWPHARRYGS